MRPLIEIKETQGSLYTIFQELAAQGKTQKELCDYIGVTYNVIVRWKKGETSSYLQRIKKIAEFLGVSPDYLLGSNTEKVNEGTVTKREEEVLKLFRTIDYNKQEHVINLLNILNS
jgi:transcriptional regulator with XRE-family HTH domain